MWNLFHSILHIEDISKQAVTSQKLAGGPFKPGGAVLQLDRSLDAALSCFPVVYSDSISSFPSVTGFGSASNIPTLNFAKNAKFRMGHPSVHLRRLQVMLSAAKLGARVGDSR